MLLSFNLFRTHLRAQIACYELKGNLSSVMLRKYFTTVWNFRNLQGFVWETIQEWLGGKSCFSNFSKANGHRVYQKLILWSTNAKGLLGLGSCVLWRLLTKKISPYMWYRDITRGVLPMIPLPFCERHPFPVFSSWSKYRQTKLSQVPYLFPVPSCLLTAIFWETII